MDPLRILRTSIYGFFFLIAFVYGASDYVILIDASPGVGREFQVCRIFFVEEILMIFTGCLYNFFD